LVVKQSLHEGPSFFLVVNLETWLGVVANAKCGALSYLSPSLHSVFYHEILGHWSRHLLHMVPIVLLTHTFLFVTTDSKA
jgi:hypothetical protein